MYVSAYLVFDSQPIHETLAVLVQTSLITFVVNHQHTFHLGEAVRRNGHGLVSEKPNFKLVST